MIGSLMARASGTATHASTSWTYDANTCGECVRNDVSVTVLRRSCMRYEVGADRGPVLSPGGVPPGREL